MNLTRLRDFTPARVGLGRVGDSLPTRELLDFQLAHARARDAVYAQLDSASFTVELRQKDLACVTVASAAPDRPTYLRRPDLGRKLNEDSNQRLAAQAGAGCDAVLVIADGLSAFAVHAHAVPLLGAVLPKLTDWKLAPIIIAGQARVALGDEIGSILGARCAVILIGERPGLNSPDSLGIYLTWNPRPGRTDAERNCISNIRADGLSYENAAASLASLMTEARRRMLSGVNLKDPAVEQTKLTDTHPLG